jgi:hypothetical protein
MSLENHGVFLASERGDFSKNCDIFGNISVGLENVNSLKYTRAKTVMYSN